MNRIEFFCMMLTITLLILVNGPVKTKKPIHRGRRYDIEAQRIKRLSCRRAKPEVIAKALLEIDRNLPKHFPKGEFKREDLIAIALVESSFNHRETGTAAKEQGLYQLRPEWFKKGVDGYQVAINTDMACRVLATKYRRWHDYRKAIIAYNGYVVRHGKLRDGYYRHFIQERTRVCRILEGGKHAA